MLVVSQKVGFFQTSSLINKYNQQFYFLTPKIMLWDTTVFSKLVCPSQFFLKLGCQFVIASTFYTLSVDKLQLSWYDPG